ncbi:MAG: thioredoxin family protein [Bacteroidia bacterium]|nr:thioredoxin family protein [Bacteroidia bacterium]
MKKLISFSLALLLGVAALAQSGYKVGDKATDFKLKNIDGEMVSMADYADAKGFVVIFTCNHCPYAKAYEDRIVALDKKYASQGYPVIAINPNDAKKVEDDSFENMKTRAKEKGFTFPYLVDGDSKVARTYGAKYTPHVFLLNKQDKDLEVAYIGAIDDNYRDAKGVEEPFLENAINSLKAGKKIEKTTTRAIGCTIKWVQQ